MLADRPWLYLKCNFYFLVNAGYLDYQCMIMLMNSCFPKLTALLFDHFYTQSPFPLKKNESWNSNLVKRFFSFFCISFWCYCWNMTFFRIVIAYILCRQFTKFVVHLLSIEMLQKLRHGSLILSKNGARQKISLILFCSAILLEDMLQQSMLWR